MKKIVFILIIMIFLGGCSDKNVTVSEILLIDTATVYSLIEDDNVYIIDVREESEYKSGHVKNAYNIPLGSLDEIDSDEFSFDSKIIVYCQSGVRSRRAAEILVEMGYVKVYNMGGINNWNYELVSD